MGGQAAVEVRNVSKTFRIPQERITTLRDSLTQPFKRNRYDVRDALHDVSLDIPAGSLTALIGRNGSGKSTLLKLIASIYQVDRGSIRVAGRLAPFIELGVGFDRDLAAADNIVLNGVMMGLTPRVARSRLDSIMEFAELEEFEGLKLRNYSSGMVVRLAFSIMAQVDADILLVDEVLAVGDLNFQRKCMDEFRRQHALGKTIVLVTHSLEEVREHCDHAVLLEGGRVESIGEPNAVCDRYEELSEAAPRTPQVIS